MKKIDQATHKAMMRARLQLMIKEPFFGTLAMQLELIECSEQFCTTMAVDGKHLWYYPKFVNDLTQPELTGVVAHEVMHCCLKHMTRRGHRHPVKWNWAGDYVINEDLLSSGFTLPKKRLQDSKYKGMSTEEVYERLPDPPKMYIVVSGGSGADGQQGLPNGADQGQCGGVIDACAPGDKVSQDNIDHDWEENVRMAVNIAKRAKAGNLPAYLQRLVKELSKPKVDWREQLRNFVDGHMTKDFSWARPNRRFVHQGLHLPGFVCDSLHHLAFFNDVSGSITQPIMSAYGGEVQQCLDHGIADQVTVLFFDTEVKKIDEYMPGDVLDLKTPGGGGTDFLPMFEWATKQPDLSCIVVLTDMMPSHWNLPDPGVPVLWGAYLPEDHLKTINPPFGQVLHIDSANW